MSEKLPIERVTTKAEVRAQILALEWALDLRALYSTASSPFETRRRMPNQIRKEIEDKIRFLKLSIDDAQAAVQEKFENFPTIKRPNCVDCGCPWFFQRMFDCICTQCGRKEEVAA